METRSAITLDGCLDSPRLNHQPGSLGFDVGQGQLRTSFQLGAFVRTTREYQYRITESRGCPDRAF